MAGGLPHRRAGQPVGVIAVEALRSCGTAAKRENGPELTVS
jgi:hypothetical protein